MYTAVIGFFSGIFSGMGIGGGMLLIPALRFFLGAGQKEAQAINLYCFIPAALCALIVHIRKKNVDFKTAIPLIITGIPCSILGAYISVNLSPRILELIFGGFILVFGIREIIMSFRLLNTKKCNKKAS